MEPYKTLDATIAANIETSRLELKSFTAHLCIDILTKLDLVDYTSISRYCNC